MDQLGEILRMGAVVTGQVHIRLTFDGVADLSFSGAEQKRQISRSLSVHPPHAVSQQPTLCFHL